MGLRNVTWTLDVVFDKHHNMATPPKTNILNPKSWRFGSDDVSFQTGDFQVPC